MKKQIPVILLTVICIVLVATLLSAKKENSRLKLQLDAPETALSAKPLPGNVLEEADRDAISAQINTDTPAMEATEDPADENLPAKRMMSGMSKMMENPTMNKVMVASQRGVIGALYSDLIEYLDLDAEETGYLMELLMHRQMKNVEAAMKIMGGELSDEERLALMEEMKTAGTETEVEIEKFLNNKADYEEFQFYEKTIGERMMLSQVDAKLAGTDDALTGETYREVLEIMHDERADFEFTVDLGDQKNTDISSERFSQANIDRYIEETLKLAENIDARLEQILTPEQLAAYHESGKAMLDMHVGQLQQAKQMFGGE